MNMDKMVFVGRRLTGVFVTTSGLPYPLYFDATLRRVGPTAHDYGWRVGELPHRELGNARFLVNMTAGMRPGGCVLAVVATHAIRDRPNVYHCDVTVVHARQHWTCEQVRGENVILPNPEGLWLALNESILRLPDIELMDRLDATAERIANAPPYTVEEWAAATAAKLSAEPDPLHRMDDDGAPTTPQP